MPGVQGDRPKGGNPVTPEDVVVEEDMKAVKVPIKTAIRIVKARNAGIPRWKAWRKRNHALHLLQKKAYRARNHDNILQKDRERKRRQKKAKSGSINAQRRAMSKGEG
jgi:hypothetical protein